MSRPTVSAVFAAYNATWCIARAIDSLLAGTIVPTRSSSATTAPRTACPTTSRAKLRRPRARAAPAAATPPPQNTTADLGSRRAAGDHRVHLADDWWTPSSRQRQLDRRHPAGALGEHGRRLRVRERRREVWLADCFQPPRAMTGDLFEPLAPLLPSSPRLDARRGGGVSRGRRHPAAHHLLARLRALAAPRGHHPGDWRPRSSCTTGSIPPRSRATDARHRDNLVLMERVAAGEFRASWNCARFGAVRATRGSRTSASPRSRAGKLRRRTRVPREGAPCRTFRAGARSRLFGSLVPAPLAKPLMQMSRSKKLVLRERLTRAGAEGRGRRDAFVPGFSVVIRRDGMPDLIDAVNPRSRRRMRPRKSSSWTTRVQ